MAKDNYYSEDYIVRHGILAVINEIFTYSRGMGINRLFSSFERIHDILAEYENRAKNIISEQIKWQCIARYSQNKQNITDNQRFLTADVIENIVKGELNTFRGIEKYQLCYCIEKIYLAIDFVMWSITDHIVKNDYHRLFRIVKYHERLVLLENDKGITFIMDRDTNTGFMGYFLGSDIIIDKVMSVCEGDGHCSFQKREIDKKIYYQMM